MDKTFTEHKAFQDQTAREAELEDIKNALSSWSNDYNSDEGSEIEDYLDQACEALDNALKLLRKA